jgi:hypothetical protein
MTPSNDNNKPYDVRESTFFEGLPPFVKETVLQSTDMINSDEDLRSAAEKIMYDYNYNKTE